MGFFSKRCSHCGLSILAPEVCNRRRAWLNKAVLLFPNGCGRCSGAYDGYGRIHNHFGEVVDTIEFQVAEGTWYHEACWLQIGSPGYSGPSEYAADQGYFISCKLYNLSRRRIWQVVAACGPLSPDHSILAAGQGREGGTVHAVHQH